MKSLASMWVVLAGTLIGWNAHAVDAATDRAERERIRAERAQVEAAFTARERECGQRFAVTRCLDEARRERRAALEHLRRQQGVLDESLRKQRAAQRMESIRSKVSAEEAQRREAAERMRRQAAEEAQAPASAAR